MTTTCKATPELIGSSAPMQQLRANIARIARSDASVLLTGPSGAGKELVARAIHAASARAPHGFSAVNCGAIPADLIESELFGHEKGAFTGAIARRIGHFEASHRGTIFLDEIGDMRFDMQVKLLRVLEEQTIVRVGSNEPRSLDMRVISATHQDLRCAIAERRFREDLFYRLGVVVVQVPALAQRSADIPAIIRHFQQKLPADRKCRFDPEAIALLMLHDWPGNVRELRNLVERATTMHPGETIDRNIAVQLLDPDGTLELATDDEDHWDSDLSQTAPGSTRTPAPGRPIDLKREIEAIELEQIHVALDLADGIIADAARLLTLKRTTLIEKMRKYGLQQAA